MDNEDKLGLEDKVAILILFFEKPKQTVQCIESFLASGCTIYVLNNGSSEEATRMLEKFISGNSKINYIKSNTNLGPAGGRNLLIKSSSEEWIFLADSDITIKPQNWLKIFTNELKLNKDSNVFLPALFNVHEKSYSVHPVFIFENNVIKIVEKKNLEFNYFPSGAAIVNRKILNTDNLFDSNLHGFEDYEFAIRCLVSKTNLTINQIEEIELRHDHRFAKAENDKKAIKTRYDADKLMNSFRYIEQKFNITFEHNWEWWSRKQIYDMTEKSGWKELKKKIHRLIDKYFH